MDGLAVVLGTQTLGWKLKIVHTNPIESQVFSSLANMDIYISSNISQAAFRWHPGFEAM